MPDGHFSRDGRRRLLMVALGRQRVGKTALLNTIVQYFRAEGNEIEVWNADQQNRTHSLDAGGGLTGFSALVETVPVIAALAAQGTVELRDLLGPPLPHARRIEHRHRLLPGLDFARRRLLERQPAIRHLRHACQRWEHRHLCPSRERGR
jgi:hypothetical protein